MQTQTATCAAVIDIHLPLDELLAERQGCGWFDSSYELRRGITVVEDLEMDEYLLCEAVQALLN